MSVRLFNTSDSILIRGTYESSDPSTVLVSSILEYIAQYDCNAFFTRCSSGANGVEVRCFNITSDTIYLCDKNHLNLSNSWGSATSADRAINANTTGYLIYYNGSNFYREQSSIVFPRKTVNNITYYYTWGDANSSDTGLAQYIGFYLPDTVTSIYINGELPLNWENITVKLKHSITQATILDLTAATADKECSYSSNTLFTPGTDFRDFVISGTEYNQDMIFADDELMLYKKNESYIQCYSYYHDSTHYGGGWKVYYQGESIGGFDSDMLGKYDKYYGVAFLIDEEHEYGQILACYSYYPNTSWNQKHYTKRLITNINKLHKAYLLIKEILTGATVKVNYIVPEGDYQYCKLTYKKDLQPESVNDGTIVNLDYTESECMVEGLEENANYWFVIYTDKNESPPFPFTVEVDPVPPEIKPYIEWINGSGNLFKKLTYNQNSINSYTYQGTTYYHKIAIDPKQTSFLYKRYARNYDSSIVGKWGVENYTYQGYTGIYYQCASAIDHLLTLEINSAETEGLYNLSIPQLPMANLTNTDTLGAILITQNGEYYKISGDTAGYETQVSHTITGASLEDIFKFIQHNFHNVNIKVNGTYWSKVN